MSSLFEIPKFSSFNLTEDRSRKVFLAKVEDTVRAIANRITDSLNRLVNDESLLSGASATSQMIHHRLTVQSGNPIFPTSAGTSTIYWTPLQGSMEYLWDSSIGNWRLVSLGEVNFTLSGVGATANGVYRIGVYWNGSAPVFNALSVTTATSMFGGTHPVQFLNGVAVYSPTGSPPWYRFLGHMMVLNGVVTMGQYATGDTRFGLCDYWFPTIRAPDINTGQNLKVLLNRGTAQFIGKTTTTTITLSEVFTGFGSTTQQFLPFLFVAHNTACVNVTTSTLSSGVFCQNWT